MKKTIYIKGKSVWAEIVAEAKRMDRSVSWYLIYCHRKVMGGKYGDVVGPEKKAKYPNPKKRPIIPLNPQPKAGIK